MQIFWNFFVFLFATSSTQLPDKMYDSTEKKLWPQFKDFTPSHFSTPILSHGHICNVILNKSNNTYHNRIKLYIWRLVSFQFTNNNKLRTHWHIIIIYLLIIRIFITVIFFHIGFSKSVHVFKEYNDIGTKPLFSSTVKVAKMTGPA